jgi:hypothetical protein
MSGKCHFFTPNIVVKGGDESMKRVIIMPQTTKIT